MKQALSISILIPALLLSTCISQNKTIAPQKSFLPVIETNFLDGSAQYKILMGRLPRNRFPKTYYAQEDSLETSGSGWWCSGFYPGTLLFLFEETKDQLLL